ncbi:hypothetical protein Tco_0578829 [Tanacetum coccineum]
MSFLKEDTHSIKTMMTEMYEFFKGQSSGSVTPTLALTHILANVEGENDTNTATEDPPSHTRGETDANRQDKSEEPKHSTDANIKEGKGIAIDEQVEDQRKLAHMDKEEKIKKAKEEARLFAISKPEVIKVVLEEAKKLGIHPRMAITTKTSEKFKKAQDAEHEVLKRQHTKNVRKSPELRKHKYDNYMWTISSRLKPETITDIKIHPKTKLVVITFFRVIQDLMNSLSRRYERIRKILAELGIKSALPVSAPAPEQASSKSSRKKRKHMELEPDIKLPRLKCN